MSTVETKSTVTTPARAGADLDDFKLLFREHPAGVCVITAETDEGPVALTATSVTSISATPPLIAFSVSDFSSSAKTLNEAERVVIHFLTADNVSLAQLCSTSGIDRFADTTLWSRLADGEPYYHGARALAVGTIVQRIVAGTATVMLAHVEDVIESSDNDGAPLVYHARTWHSLSSSSAVA